MADAGDASALSGPPIPYCRATPDGPDHIHWLVMVWAVTRTSNDGTTQPISLRIPVLSNESRSRDARVPKDISRIPDRATRPPSASGTPLPRSRPAARLPGRAA